MTPSRADLENFAKRLTACLVLSVPDVNDKLHVDRSSFKIKSSISLEMTFSPDWIQR